ncbi:hypothetical protein E6R62_39210, partial [Streptomyces sp. A1136]
TAYPEEVVDRKCRTEAARLHRVLDALGERRDAEPAAPTLARVIDHLTASDGEAAEHLADRIAAEVAVEEAASAPPAPGPEPWGADAIPLFPLQPPRTGRELLADHVTAMVCCAAVDTAGALPGLDWLDGPSLLIDDVRRSDLASPVLTLVEDLLGRELELADSPVLDA